MEDWMSKSYSGSSSRTLPVLSLRLMMIIILAHLNTGNYWPRIMELLKTSMVASELPRQFMQKIIGKADFYPQRMFAEAFDAVDDPLVVMRPEKSSELSDLNAIFVTPSIIQSRTELLEILFPKKSESDHSDGCTDFVQATNSSRTTSTTECRSERILAVNECSKPSEKFVKENSKKINDVQTAFKEFWDLIDKILIQDFDVGNLPSIVDDTLKELRGKLSSLDAALACLVMFENQQINENDPLIGEMKCLYNELKHFYNALDLREKPVECIISSLKEFGVQVNAKRFGLKPSGPDVLVQKEDLATIEQLISIPEEKDEHVHYPLKTQKPAGSSVATSGSKHSRK